MTEPCLLLPRQYLDYSIDGRSIPVGGVLAAQYLTYYTLNILKIRWK